MGLLQLVLLAWPPARPSSKSRRRRGTEASHARRARRPLQRRGPLHPPLPAVAALVMLAFELHQARQAERLIAHLQHRSHTDPLTGLGNRWAFDADLASRLSTTSGARRSDPVRTSLLIADIDHFKPYNDRHGHPAGDDSLARVARAIQHACRRGDGVHRIGGEEFAVVLTADHHESLVIAERIRRAVVCATGGQLTVSLGVATAGTDDAETLIGEADRALYRAKARGRNCIDSDRLAS
jgi:diguanylate cyclase (GGDEF)-like protein